MTISYIITSLWLEILGIGVLVISLFVAFWVRTNKLKHQQFSLQSALAEKAELLSYAADRERREKERAAEAMELKKKLLSRINHEIRTPMHGVMGMVSLLSETPLTAEQKEYNETIKNCGESLLAVINDILLGDVLAHSKIESHVELEQKEFDLRNTIEEVFEVLTRLLMHKDIELVYEIDHRIPAHVIGDNSRLTQVLMNLIENGIKFTNQGEIFVRVGLKSEKDNKLNLEFEVEDSGVGIAPDELKFLLHTIDEPGIQRNGVGLFLSKRHINLMGGTMAIQSTVNEGTIIFFDIQVIAPPQQQKIYAEMSAVEGKKILVVEDNAVLRNVLQKELSHWKLIPAMAENGEQALEILSEKPGIELVLVEMEMPVMNGINLSQRIRELYPFMPIILLGVSNSEAAKQHTDMFRSIINKPLRYGVLSQHILSGLINKEEKVVIEKTKAKQILSNDFALKYPLRILIAEDNPLNQKLAMKILNKLGYTPAVVSNGKEVLEEVSKVDYDLILMDVQMPEMDGLEATRMIRLCLSNPPIIIAMTANTMQGDREDCINAGVDDYISKPVNIEELVIMLEKWALQVKTKR
jgi:CheY-like chemotaxis protein/signal transduction histidine kinase